MIYLIDVEYLLMKYVLWGFCVGNRSGELFGMSKKNMAEETWLLSAVNQGSISICSQ